MTGISELDDAGLREVLEQEQRPVIVDFWTPTCAPCRTLKPHIARLAEEHPELRVVAVNAARETMAAERYDVRAVPTLIIFKDGTERRRMTGSILPSRLEAAMDELAA